MGPETILALFKEAFENLPENYKYAVAPAAILWYRDALSQLECSMEICDDLQARKDAAQYMIDYVTPYLPSSGGGGSGSGS